MTTSMKKTLLVSLVTFATIIAAIGVIYVIRKPSLPPTLNTSPAPTAISEAAPTNTPEIAPILAVDPVAACSLKFVVTCNTQHHACNTTTKACEIVAGAGADTCTTDANCVEANHHVCNTTTHACEVVAGTGVDTCTNNADCMATVPPSPSPSAPPQASLDCVTKRVYADDSRNRAGFYYLENQIADANTIQDGQIIVYNVVARNNGGNSAPDTTITDTLSSNLTYVDGDSSCSYDSTTRVVTCTIGTLTGASEAARSFRARISVSGTGKTSIANTAEVSSTNGQRDSCSVQVDATGKIIVPPSNAPTALPVAGVFEVTAGTLGIGVLLLVAGALGLLLI